VVIYGGEKVFAAGADVTEMAGRTYPERESFLASGPGQATFAGR